MIRVGVFGATGRVGKLLIEDLKGEPNLALSAVHVYDDLDFSLPPGVIATSEMRTLIQASDIIIDFTTPEATQSLLEAALEHPKAIVIGTTGLNSHQSNLLRQASELMPILYATNMSLGVALLSKLVQIASQRLKGFDIEIVEQHHRNKIDAPSGTALTLAESAARGRGLDLDKVRVSGRNGNIGKRSSDEIAVMALRGGDIVGRHTVGFYNDGEFIELNHTATSRNTFSKGALRAAEWLYGKEPGLYSIADSLELE
ncbi:MAG: 4-hydroxy-tetrahydrodipicolinate reductase [Campylobacterales bacterium]|nr:4-hydroxy-tetrahydrodipicolinate reductase [Campylobacterales bacterium]